MKNRIIYFLLFSLFTFSCQKVIDLDVNDVEPQMVIEANYDAIEQKVEVRISKSVNVFAPSEFPAVGGAQVDIIDQNGVSSSLVDQGNGIYVLENYSPNFGETYSINVVAEGQSYNASDLLPAVVPVDSLTQEFLEESLFGDEGYIVYTNFTDPQSDNFYRANRIVNGDSLNELGDQFIFDDGFSNGNSQAVPFFGTRHEVNDTIVVQFISYSKNSFDYYSQLFDIAGESGQSAAPANPEYSWTNNALGHFAAYGYDVDTIIIEP